MNPYAVNPAAHFYVKTDGIAAYSRPGCVIIASMYTINKPEVQAARAAGAIVLLYVDFMEIPKNITDPDLLAFCAGANPWPYMYKGTVRVNWPGTWMTDITVGSKWSTTVVTRCCAILDQSNNDGLYIDVSGARLWYKSAPTQAQPDWDLNWSQVERDEWTAGNVYILRQIDIYRRAICPRKIIVNNNTWTGNGALGQQGEQYVNGCNLEQHAPDPASSTWAYASRPFSGLWPRVMMVTVRSPTFTALDAQKWTGCPDVTHVAWQPNYIDGAPPPVVPPFRIDYSRAA